MALRRTNECFRCNNISTTIWTIHCRFAGPVRAKYGNESEFFDLDVSKSPTSSCQEHNCRISTPRRAVGLLLHAPSGVVLHPGKHVSLRQTLSELTKCECARKVPRFGCGNHVCVVLLPCARRAADQCSPHKHPETEFLVRLREQVGTALHWHACRILRIQQDRGSCMDRRTKGGTPHSRLSSSTALLPL